MMKLLVIALIALTVGFTPSQRRSEYMLITDIQPYSAGVDLVTVCDGDGDESQFFADSYTYMGGSFCKVTVENGKIVIVE